ncbi:MAG: hypothetical protein AB1689_20675, partial [Thermodesulfobacteriota bacterium]
PTVPPSASPAPSANDDCRRAESAWRSAAAAARAPLARLDACLAGGRPPCAELAVELRRALGELAAAEERLRWLCGEARP